MKPYGMDLGSLRVRDYDLYVYGKRTSRYRRFFRPDKVVRRAMAKTERQRARQEATRAA